MRPRTSLFILLCPLFLLATPLRAASANGSFCQVLFEKAPETKAASAIRLNFSANQVIAQRDSSQTCVIYALFHSIKLGAFNKNHLLGLAYEKLENSENHPSPTVGRFEDFESYMISAKSELFKNQSRLLLDENGNRAGIETGADLNAILRDVNQMIGEDVYRQGSMRRQRRESDSAFLTRVQSMIAHSLAKSVPPLISYSKSSWSLKKSTKKRNGKIEESFEAKQEMGHSITVIGVSEIKKMPGSRRTYFRAQVYEQVSEQILELDFMVDPRVRAVSEIPQRQGQKKSQFAFWNTRVVGEIENEKGLPGSPYLSVFLHSRKDINSKTINYDAPSFNTILPRTLADLDSTEKHITWNGEEPIRSWDEFFTIDTIAGDF